MSWDTSITVTAVVFISIFLILIRNCYNFFMHRDVRRVQILNENLYPAARYERESCDEGNLSNLDICSICLEPFEFKVDTNCGHHFCGNCFTSYWHVGNFVRAVHCPMCRSNVNQLEESFTDTEAQTNSAEKRRIVDEISCFNRLYSNTPRSWTQQLLDWPVVIRHGFRHIFDDVTSIGIIHRLRIAVLATIVMGYCLSPFDVFPEAGFGVLGVLDDVLIFATFLMYLVVFLRRAVGHTGDGNGH